MKDIKQKLSALGFGFLFGSGFFFIFLGLLLINSYAFVFLWKWFIVPLGVKEVNFYSSLGIMTVAAFLNKEIIIFLIMKIKSEKVLENLVTIQIFAFCLFIFGWIVYMFS